MLSREAQLGGLMALDFARDLAARRARNMPQQRRRWQRRNRRKGTEDDQYR